MSSDPRAPLGAPPSGSGNENSDAGDGGQRTATLAFLLRRMRRRADFPAAAANIAELRAHTRELDRAQVSEVANVILKDYALSTKLLKLVNSSFYGQYGGRINTISRAVVMLGIRQVQSAALSLLMFEHLADHEQTQALRESAGRSILSGMLARGLAERVSVADSEQVFVCAMLRRLGEYLAIFYLPEEYAAIRAAVQTGGDSEEAACRHVLGLDYAELGIGVAREWHLPEDFAHCMRPLPAGNLPAARGDRDLLQQLAAFGDELAGLLLEPASPERAQRLAALTGRYGRSVPVDAAELVPIINRAIEDSRAYAGVVGQGVGRCQTLRRAGEWQGGEQPTDSGPGDDATADEGADNATGDDATAPGSERREALLRGIQDVSTALLEGCSLNDVLLMVLETMFRGLGLTRVLFCVHDRRNGQVIARFGLGPDIEEVLKRFRFDPRGADDLFARAVNQRADVLYPGAGQRPADLPAWYRALLSPAGFAVLPVVINGVCIGLIYGDHQSGGTSLSGDTANYLNTLRNQAALAIKQHR